MFLRAQHSAIGIDIGPGAVKMVQFRGGPGRLELVAAARLGVEFPSDGQNAAERARFVKQFGKFLSARRFGARRAVLTLPPGDVDVRPLTLAADEQDVSKKVKWEAESYLGYGVDEAIISHVVLGEAKSAGERRLEVLAAAAQRSKVLRSLEIMSHSGLMTEAIDIVPLALCRLLARLEPGSEGAVAVVDMGASTTHAVIMNGRELRMTRTIESGGDTFTEALRTGLEISVEEAEVLKRQHGIGASERAEDGAEAEAADESGKIGRIIHDILRDKVETLAGELQKLFRYFSAQNQGRPIDKVYLVGGGGALKGLDTHLAKRLNAKVEAGNPLSRLTGVPVELRDGNEGSYAVAAGLALREA